MLFNSYEFIFLFLPITFAVYFFLNHRRYTLAGKTWLTLASLFFYSWWDIKYLPLILLSIIFNYAAGAAMAREKGGADETLRVARRRRLILIIGISGNLLLLGYYKYVDFFIKNINHIVGADLNLLHIILPLGISFFTFTQIAYLVDVYKGIAREYDFINYGLFVTFFPHLLAGPIIHHKEMMPQFDRQRNKLINYKNISLGLYLFVIGLAKKVLIADTFAVWATNGFDHAPELNFLEAWATSLSYSLQLYYDFSGYTDMALGSSWIFNIRLPINFNSPYKALDIQDFWRRWHITLTRFLRDYLYIPLGGNRVPLPHNLANIMMTFLLGGFWHGAGWTFVFWGFLHGLAMAAHRLWHGLGFRLPNAVAWFLTFQFVNVTWVFFRAKTWPDAIKVLKGMAGLNGLVLPYGLNQKLAFLKNYGVTFGAWITNVGGNLETFVLIAVFLAIAAFCKNSNEMSNNFKPSLVSGAFTLALSIGCFLSMGKVSEFLYFNF